MLLIAKDLNDDNINGAVEDIANPPRIFLASSYQSDLSLAVYAASNIRAIFQESSSMVLRRLYSSSTFRLAMAMTSSSKSRATALSILFSRY
jgi:hypothetical protein